MYEVTMRGILARELADTIATQLQVGLPDGMTVDVLSRAPHADGLDAAGLCVKEGCVLHRQGDDERPTGGDGDPDFPGGIGCMGQPGDECHTLWATSVSLQMHELATGHGD